MNTPKPIFRRLALRIAFFNLLVCLALNGAAYWLLGLAMERTTQLARTHAELSEVVRLAAWVDHGGQLFLPYFVPATVVFFLIITLLTAWSARRAVTGLLMSAGAPAAKPRKAAPAAEPPPRNRQAEAAVAARREADDKRLFLHLVAVLQKEGRLLDFFSEDLSAYNDGQIGAAVRSIHENCKKAIDGHIAPQAILTQQEDEEIEVAADFDPNALKLVGNVTGRPPFKGIVRHRGWQARRLELPAFSGNVAPEIIAPAEIEVR